MTITQPVPVFGFGEIQRSYPKPSEVLKSLTHGHTTAFGKKGQIRKNAFLLVTFLKMQKADMWQTFSIMDLVHFYNHMGWPPETMFDGLVGPWTDPAEKSDEIHTPPVYLVSIFLGRFAVTADFINECIKRRE